MNQQFGGSIKGFSGGSDGKESTCNAGDPGSFPGSGRSPGGGNGHPLQYSCLENPVDRGAWWVYLPGGCKELDMTERQPRGTWWINKWVGGWICSWWIDGGKYRWLDGLVNGLVMYISHCVKVNINISLHSLVFFNCQFEILFLYFRLDYHLVGPVFKQLHLFPFRFLLRTLVLTFRKHQLKFKQNIQNPVSLWVWT